MKLLINKCAPSLIVVAILLCFAGAAHADTSIGSNNGSTVGTNNGSTIGTNEGTSIGTNTGCNGPGDSGLMNPLGGTCSLTALIDAVLSFIVKDVGPVVITLMLVYCGFLFVAAQGNEEKLGQARTALMWTVIGAIILLGAVTIEAVISNTVSSL